MVSSPDVFSRVVALATFTAFGVLPALPAAARNPERVDAPSQEPDIHFVPTPQEAVEKMLEMAGIKKNTKVYDLGCGDGRIVITAAKKYGARGVGVDIDPKRVKESRANVTRNQVEDLVTIEQADIFKFDFSAADVVTLYLLSELNVRLMPQLKKLKPGARIVSYDFDMKGAKPAEVHEGLHDRDGNTYRIYKWVVPWQEEALVAGQN